jgi:hypothetical protein
MPRWSQGLSLAVVQSPTLRGANSERGALREKHTECWLARLSFAEGCAPRVREDVSVECRGHSLANPTGQGPPMRLSKRRWPEAECRGGAKGFPWRSCGARPSEGATPSVWPCGKSTRNVGWPEYRLRRDALRASVKICRSNAEAIRLRIVRGGSSDAVEQEPVANRGHGTVEPRLSLAVVQSPTLRGAPAQTHFA